MSTGVIIGWAIGTFGLVGAIALAAVLLGFGPTLLGFFVNTKIGRIIAGIGTLGIMFLVVYLKGRGTGEAARAQAEKKQTAKEVAKAEQHAIENEGKTDDELRKEAGSWYHPPK